MVCWLCRLTSEELEQCNDWVDEARELGVNAWVVSVEAQGSDLKQADLLRNLGEQPNGLPFALEWCITEPLSLEAEYQALVVILPWLQHVRVYLQGARPLLMIRGIEQCVDFRLIVGRIRRMFLAGGFDHQPLLVASCPVPVDGFDGSYEHIQLPKQGADLLKRADYECHLRDAHWHAPPNGCLIPAVLAVEEQHQIRYCNANAARYREWLKLMSHWSVLQQNGDSMAPVLLESWSGHRRWWSASSQNSSEPLVTSPASDVQELHWGQTAAEHLALMVHGFYLDGLDLMLQRLDPQSVPALDLYVSTPIRQVHSVAALLRRQGWSRVRLFGVPNRGRDLAPFVRHLLPAALSVGHHAFIKVHTKSSPHLADGQDWGDHLIDSMLDETLIGELQDRLYSDSELGLLSPAGTVVPITLQLHNNGLHLGALQRRFDLDGQQLLAAHFIAGTMFAGRLDVLESLCATVPALQCFEPEAGQTDGTFAHALERWIGVLVQLQGKRLDELPGDDTNIPSFGYKNSTTIK